MSGKRQYPCNWFGAKGWPLYTGCTVQDKCPDAPMMGTALDED